MAWWRLAVTIAVASCMVLPVFAQDDVDVTIDRLEERREEGMYYDREMQRWYSAEETGAEMTDEGRMRDTSIPGWEYDPEARLWYDTERPGWAWDPMTGRWYSEDRPGQAYDMRTGRWYPVTQPGTYYDADQGRWYYDPDVAQMRGEGRRTVPYFDEQAGRWREEPVRWRYYDEGGRYTGRYYTRDTGEPMDPREMMQAQPVGEVRDIYRGSVTLSATPATLTPGPATLGVSVDGVRAGQAQITGYLYRPNAPQQGRTIDFNRINGMAYADLQVPSVGQWELALRISRPGFEDERVYYTLDVQPQQ